MKAWIARIKGKFCATVVFAETRGKAKSAALYTYCCEDANFCDIENTLNYPKKSRGVMAAIVANCHYSDIREGLIREKEDIRKEKRREHRQRRKNNA